MQKPPDRSYILIAFIFIALIIPTLFVSADDTETDRFLVMFHEEPDETIFHELDAVVHSELSSINTLVVSMTASAADQVAQIDDVTTVERDESLKVSENWSDWGVERIQAHHAWEHDLRGEGIDVAVIDTGISTEHPDIDIEKGISVVDYTEDYNDDHGHGSHVAGVIAGNRGEGMRGIAPEASIYAIKALDDDGDGFYSHIIEGIEWAVEQEVDVINLSVGGNMTSNSFQAAIEAAAEEGSLLVAAGGNDGHETALGDTVEYPAAYEDVIAVASIGQTSERSPFSAHGPEIEVAAPGEHIHSIDKGTGYKTTSGTSLAAPHVTGMLAILQEAHPLKERDEIRALLHDYAVHPDGDTRDDELGYGVIEFPETIELGAQPLVKVENVTVTVDTNPSGEENKSDGETEDGKTNKYEVTIEWDDPNDNEVAGYYIYRDGEEVANIKDPSYSERVESGTYQYEVAAYSDKDVVSEKVLAEEEAIVYDYANGEHIAKQFIDVDLDDWYVSELAPLVDAGTITGYEDETFRPHESMTRAEAAVTLMRDKHGDIDPRATSFDDVADTHYASGWIEAAFDEEVITGYEDETFRPDEEIRRGEFAVLLMRFFELEEVTSAEQHSFTDVDGDEFYAGAVAMLTAYGYAEGYEDDTYRPERSVSRSELSALFSRMTSEKTE